MFYLCAGGSGLCSHLSCCHLPSLKCLLDNSIIWYLLMLASIDCLFSCGLWFFWFLIGRVIFTCILDIFYIMLGESESYLNLFFFFIRQFISCWGMVQVLGAFACSASHWTLIIPLQQKWSTDSYYLSADEWYGNLAPPSTLLTPSPFKRVLVSYRFIASQWECKLSSLLVP